MNLLTISIFVFLGLLFLLHIINSAKIRSMNRENFKALLDFKKKLKDEEKKRKNISKKK